MITVVHSIIRFAIPLLILAGCSIPNSYQRTIPLAPLIDEKGEAQVIGTAGLRHLEGVVGYSPLSGLSVLGQAYISAGTQVEEINLGTYLRKPNYSLTLTGGYGQGQIREEYVNFCLTNVGPECLNYDLDIAYEKWTIHPGLNLRGLGGGIEAGLSAKLSYVDYRRFQFDYSDVEEDPRGSLSPFLPNNTGWFIEPNFTLSMNEKRWTFLVQTGLTGDLFNSGFHPYYKSFFVNGLLGFRIGPKGWQAE